LFTALCRGLGIPARLVVSIQSVPWQAGIDKLRPSYRKHKPTRKNGEYVEAEQTSKAGSSDSVNGPDGLSVPTMSEKAKGKQKAKPEIRLRKTKDQGHNLGRSRLGKLGHNIYFPIKRWFSFARSFIVSSRVLDRGFFSSRLQVVSG
jgi:xeroderma pigmentosum group C-complementing protein